MKRYVWVLSAEIGPYFKKSDGVSDAYVLPQLYASVDATALAGGFIWIILRGTRGDALFARFYIEVVEQFEDGFNAGDFLLTTDLAKSYRCSTTYDSGIVHFPVSETSSLSLGLNEVEDDFFGVLSSHARNATAIKLQKPSNTMLSRVVLPHFQGISTITPEAVMAATTRHLLLEEIWASNKPKLPPFANFAYYAVLVAFGEAVAQSLLNDLSLLDPTLIVAESSKSINNIYGRTPKPVVDVNMLPIDPDSIYARKFIARSQNAVGLDDIAIKTEHAEKKHQDMLRDIAIRLIHLGFLPLQSSSIDLFVATRNAFLIFELKSATVQNAMNQAAKGIFQLACYVTALVEKGYSCGRLVLVLETTGIHELDSYIFNALRTLGLSALFYDGKKPWPNRLNGLEEIIGR